MLFACARHFRRPIKDRDEVWVEAGAAAYIALLGAEEEELRVEACAEALRAGLYWAGGSCQGDYPLRVVSPEEI